MKENIKAMNKNTEANKKTKVINKNTEADKKIEKMSENIKRKQIAKMNEDTDEDEYDVNISGYCWNFVLAPENVESDKENGKEKTEKNVKAVKRMKKVKENVEAAQETEKMTTNTEVIKKVRKVSKKTKADKKINEMSKDMENKKYEEDEEDDVYENYQVGKNIEATKETEKRSENTNVDKKIEEICEKQDKIISILENMSKQETTTHKYEKDFKVGKNIEATKETEKRSENTNVDKKIEEISEKQNKKIEGITEKQDKIISILENMSKQEATTHKCDKDFKAGEITTADKEEENNIAAKEIENINKRIEKIENKITKVNKKLKKIIKEDKKNKEYEKRQIGKNIEATKQTIQTSTNMNIDKEIKEISEKENKKIEEISEKQNKKIEKLSEKQNIIISILENLINKQVTTTHKCDKDFKALFDPIEQNIETTRETIKTSENTNIDKKIKEIFEKKNKKIEEQDKKIEQMTEKLNKIMSILENISKQEATTHKDFKAKEITTACKEEKKNIEAKEIENMNENIEINKKMKILNEIIKTYNTLLEIIITDTKDKKNTKADKKIKEYLDCYSKLSASLESERENIEKEGSTTGKMNANEASIIEKVENVEFIRKKMNDEIIQRNMNK